MSDCPTPLRSSSCGVLSVPAATTTAPARTVCRSPAVDVLDAGRLARLRSRLARRLRRPAARARPAPARRGCTCSSSTCRHSWRSPGGTSRSSCSSRPCTREQARARGRAHGSRARPCARSSASRPARARRARPRPGRSTAGGRPPRTARRSSFVNPLAACHLATSCSWARSATLLLMVVVPPTQRPARNATTSPLGKRREAQRPPDVVIRFRLPAREVGSGAVRPAFEQQHVATALGELACDRRRPRRPSRRRRRRTRSFIDDPRYDQSLFRRVASGELKSISAQAPGPSMPGATKSL